MEFLLLVIGSITCAVLTIRATRLLSAALWLAGVSILIALILYGLGAHEVAVIELSVGAGLVTVLFVFAITIAGDDSMRAHPLIPKPLVWILIALVLLLLGFLIMPSGESPESISSTSFAEVFWHERALDVLAQIALIFAGVLSILGLLPKPKAPPIPLSTFNELDTQPAQPQPMVEEQALPEKELA